VGISYNAPLTVSGGNEPYTWSTSTLPKGLTLDSASGQITGLPALPGTFAFQLHVTDSKSHTAMAAAKMTVSPAQTSASYDGPAELPLIYLQTAMSDTPAPGAIILVTAGGNLQTALNKAQCGDTIALQAGATFTGLFTIPAKPCDDQHWIIIRTSSPDTSLPAEGVRMSPCYAGVSSLPGRPALNCTSAQNVLAKISFQSTGNGPLQFESGANHYRFIGLEITRGTGTGWVDALLSAEATAGQLIIDRSWVHGTSQDETSTGVSLGGLNNTAVISSYLNDFHCTSKVGTCIDSNAIGGGCGSATGGPYAIMNNFLEASGENILFGGCAAVTTPTDIQISQNHFFKPVIWMSGTPGYVGGKGGHPFVVKNHLEFKNAQRVLVEDNIFEYSWGGFTQDGHSILLTPKNQYNGNTKLNDCPLCLVTDITIRYSTISHVAAGIAIGTSLSDGGGQASAGERYSIHDVVIDDIDGAKYDGGGGFLEYSNGWTANVLNSVTINHVTAFPNPTGHVILMWNNTTNPEMWGFTFTNNIVNATDSPIANGNGSKTSCAIHDVPLASLNDCFVSYTFTGNVFPAPPSQFGTSSWPTGNFFPSSVASIQFVNYNNGSGGDYNLSSTSPYKNAGSDGEDPGADIALVNAGITGVY
jgi:hypothetical protein